MHLSMSLLEIVITFFLNCPFISLAHTVIGLDFIYVFTDLKGVFLYLMKLAFAVFLSFVLEL